MVLFIGGLGDGINTMPYSQFLADEIQNAGWGVVELVLSSTYGGLGIRSVKRDIEGISKAVEYFREEYGSVLLKRNIVLWVIHRVPRHHVLSDPGKLTVCGGSDLSSPCV